MGQRNSNFIELRIMMRRLHQKSIVAADVAASAHIKVAYLSSLMQFFAVLFD